MCICSSVTKIKAYPYKTHPIDNDNYTLWGHFGDNNSNNNYFQAANLTGKKERFESKDNNKISFLNSFKTFVS